MAISSDGVVQDTAVQNFVREHYMPGLTDDEAEQYFRVVYHACCDAGAHWARDRILDAKRTMYLQPAASGVLNRLTVAVRDRALTYFGAEEALRWEHRKACYICERQWSLWVRPHHCRKCNRTICSHHFSLEQVYHGCSARDFRGERKVVEATLRELRRVTKESAGHSFVAVDEPLPAAALQLQDVKLDAKAIVSVRSAGRDSFDLIVKEKRCTRCAQTPAR
jgi:hypothetical protein